MEKIFDGNMFTRNALSDPPLVALRISQLGLKSFTDFVVILPKSSTIFRLQLEIARHQFDGSVSPLDIVIFLSKVDNAFEKIEKRVLKRENMKLTGSSSPTVLEADINYAIGIAPEFICDDSSRTLISYFPDMKNFRLPPEVKQSTTPVFLKDLVENEQQFSIKRSKRYNEFYASDKLETKKQSKLQNHQMKDYDYPTYSIFFDVKEYCKIKTYKNNFEQNLKLDSNWIMKPTDLNSPRELLYVSPEPDFVHSSLLLYDLGGKTERRQMAQVILNTTNTLPKDSEDIEKRKGNLSFKTIAFLKAKSKVKKMDVDKRLESRPSKAPLKIESEVPENNNVGLQLPNIRRFSKVLDFSPLQDPLFAKKIAETQPTLPTVDANQIPSKKDSHNAVTYKKQAEVQETLNIVLE